MGDDEDPDDSARYSAPLPPEDRLWRHPSELGAARAPQGTEPSDDPAPRPTAARRSPWGIAAASAAIGAVAAVGALLAIGLDPDRDHPVEERQVPSAADADASQLAQDALPSIVRLEVPRHNADIATGSGVLFRDDGHLLTTADLLGDAEEITAVLYDGRTVTGRVVGTDPANDIGVVDLDLDGAPTAAIGSPDALQQGEAAIVISPAPGPGTAPLVVRAVVTDLARTVVLADGTSLYGMLGLDGHIGDLAPGSVLLDQDGGVVAVATGRYPGPAVHTPSPTVALTVQLDDALPARGTAWLTPVDFAHDVATQIIEGGRPRHAWLGVVDEPMDDAEPAEPHREGAWVPAVAEGSPADVVGLQRDDVIVAVAGHRITSMDELVVTLRSLEPGDAVEVEYLRDGAARSCRPVLAESGV